MTHAEKTKEQLVAELAELRQQLEAAKLADKLKRRESEDALRQSLGQLQTIYEGMNDGLLIADIETKRFVRANASMCKMLGYSEAELLAKSVKDIHPADALPLVAEHFRAMGDGSLRRSEDVPLLRKDGSVFFATIGISYVEINNRRCVAGFFRDSTERKQAEETLRESEERFRGYFEQGLLGMAVTNKRMEWIEVNDRFCEILGYPKEEVLHRKIADFVHPDDLPSFLSTCEEVISGEIGHYTVDCRYIRKDGTVIYLNIFVKIFRSSAGAPDHFLALFDDVTERIQAEKDLREANRKLIVTLESITDGFVFIDRNWKYEYVNEAAARYLHKTREEMLGSECWELFPEAKGTKLFGEFHRAVRENIPVHFEEYYPPLGVWYEAHCYPSLEGLSVYFRDITQRKLDEEARERDHRTLEYLLQSSDHERQTIAYEIHDGLAQYLAGSLMQFQTYSHLKTSKPEQALKAYEAAMTMLQQSHYEARRLIAGVRPPVLDEAGVVEAIAHLINEHNREKGPTIKFQSEVQFSRLVSILENAVYRICQEALSNACKHSQSPQVRVRLSQQNDRIRIEIRDWGKGFKPADVKDGCYGLAGIRERARLLGGKLRIQSAVGKGTRIRVELPLMEQAE